MLTKKQIEFVKYICDLDWIDSDSKESDEQQSKTLKKILTQVDTPELHYYICSEYSWANGAESIKILIDHPHCDYGTALMLYWRAEPISVRKLRERSKEKIKSRREFHKTPMFEDTCKLLDYIEKKLINNEFNSNLFSISPSFIDDYEYELAVSQSGFINKELLKTSAGKRLPEFGEISGK